MRVTALLPLKGHSQRVKNKNMRLFDKKPLYHMVANSLLSSKYIDKIFINTDSKVIADDIKKTFQNKIIIINRPQNIQGDFVSMNEIIKYDLSQSESEHFLQTHSTNPLLLSEDIDRAIEAYFKYLNLYDSLFSVTKIQTRLYDADVKPLNHNPKKLLRTQDLEPLYEENSNLYIFSKTSFKNANYNRIGLKPQIFELSKLYSIDIDEEADFVLAEILYKNKELLKC